MIAELQTPTWWWGEVICVGCSLQDTNLRSWAQDEINATQESPLVYG